MIIKILQKTDKKVIYHYITNVKVLKERFNEACLVCEKDIYEVRGLFRDKNGSLSYNGVIYLGELIIDKKLSKSSSEIFGIIILNVEFYDGSKETYLIQDWFEYQLFNDYGIRLELEIF